MTASPLSAFERQDFIDAYTRLLVEAWRDEAFHRRLMADPRSALTDMGLYVPEGTQIEIETPELTGDAGSDVDGLERQVELFHDLRTTGILRLMVPREPQVDASELDLADLDSIAAGATYCCCCSCPNASCCSG